MNRETGKRAVYWIALLLFLALAVFLSRQTGKETAEVSGGLTAWLIPVLRGMGIAADPETLHALLRKAAHVVIYLVLGFLVCRAFRLSFRGGWVMPAAAAVCLAAAVLDEVQKGAAPGRHCQWDEAALNAACVLVGLLLGWLAGRLSARQRKKTES